MSSMENDPFLGVVERQTEAKKRRRSRISAFSSANLHKRFEQHVSSAQNFFLQGDKDAAEREATLALRIHPTDHLFALLAVIADSKGQRDRASDFRLLQAFLAKDAVLWEELLHEFLQEQFYYKSAVCLQRLSALETKDKDRYRTLQLQLADLYVGLGEFKRAANILIPLWNGSRCRDFEVFALLSSLFFQLGRWNSLHRLIESSLKNAFCQNVSVGTDRRKIDLSVTTSDAGKMTADGDGEVAAPSRRRTSKRIRFFGDDNNNDNDDGADNNADSCIRDSSQKGVEDASHQQEKRRREETNSTPIPIPPPPSSFSPTTTTAGEVGEEDEFDFSNLTSGAKTSVSQPVDTAPSTVVNSLYGDTIELRTATEKKNFLTLVNVHAELLNEEGQFHDTVRLLEFTAGCLQVLLLELPPDLLVRLGVAYAYLGGLEQQCREVFQHLIDTCPMMDYGDILYDAANALKQVGLHTEALLLFQTLRRYHEFCLSNLTGKTATATTITSTNTGNNIMNKKEKDDEEIQEVKIVFTASLFAEGQCEASLGNTQVAFNTFRRVLEIDPKHLQARLALGRMYMYEMKDAERAVMTLTPREDEQPLERIQLGEELVRVFARAEKYVEAIALGVSIFELIFSGDDDGDTESIAPGSSRRGTGTLSMPTLSRAGSAILPPSAISDFVNGPRLGSERASSIGRLSHNLATSIKASSAVFRTSMARRGNASLTNSIYGASAAASTAAGWNRLDEEERLKDSSTIFRFNRTQKRMKRPRQMNINEGTGNNKESNSETDETKVKRKKKDESGGEEVDEEEKDGDGDDDNMREVKRRKRIEEVTRCGAESFWRGEEKEDDNDGSEHMSSKDKNNSQREKENTGNSRNNEERQRKGGGDWDERDLADLEDAILHAEDEDDSNLAQYELPSLEEVSRQFSDPTMQDLFMKASSNDVVTGPRNPWEPDVAFHSRMGDAGTGGGFSPSTFRVTIREALMVLGRAGFIELAVTVMNCYSAIGKFTEAKEFAFLVLTRCPRTSIFRHTGALERPLRWAILRAALASKESEDAYRVGIRLLQECSDEEEKNQVIELLFGVLNRVGDGNAILLRLVADRNQVDPPMLVLLGNRYFIRRSYIRALNLYLAALQKRPHDALICFLVGVSYILISHQKKIRARESCVVAGWHYLYKYQELVRVIDAGRIGEAVYNCARAFQYLGLHHLAIPLYEQVAYDFCVPEQCTVALQRAARFNMYFTYRWRTRNMALALAALQQK